MDPKEISTLSLLSVEVVHDTPGVALRGVGKIRESPHPTLRPEFISSRIHSVTVTSELRSGQTPPLLQINLYQGEVHVQIR